MTESPADGWDAHVHVFDGTVATRAGHYRPAQHPLEAIEATAAAQGVGHLVLVQPSVYGSDNAVMLQALARRPGRHRGIAVVDSDVGDATLAQMHALGVRGVRFNRVSPVGESAPPAERFARLAPRLRSLGWHVQWYVRPAELPLIAELHQGSSVDCVLDHLGGLGAGMAADDPAWQAVTRLAAQGAWLKLSGWYRLGAAEPYTALLPTIRRLAALFGERLVWGSDWPHTQFAPASMPSYASTWLPVVEALGPAAAAALRRRPPAIYGPPCAAEGLALRKTRSAVPADPARQDPS